MSSVNQLDQTKLNFDRIRTITTEQPKRDLDFVAVIPAGTSGRGAYLFKYPLSLLEHLQGNKKIEYVSKTNFNLFILECGRWN